VRAVLASIIGEAVGGVAKSALDSVAEWIIQGATQITGFLAHEMTATTTPQLSAAWYLAQFQPMADLGAALGLLVTLIALASAAVRRDPDALAKTFAGIAKAGVGTCLLVALTMIALTVADEISSAVLKGSPHQFWSTVAHAWGAHSFGGFGSSALAMLIALVEVFAALFVWLELIVRDAAIYLAVLFFPVVLAAGIWPALSSWPARLGRMLLLLVILKPVALIVLCFAGNAAAAGLSFGARGVSGSVGTILAATVILGLAAFAPWTLMYLLAADAESAYASAAMRHSAATATTSSEGRSVRTLGGLRNQGSQGNGGGMGNQGSCPGGGSPSGNPSGGGEPPSGGHAGTSEASSPAGSSTAAQTVGTGAVGAAAGMAAQRQKRQAPRLRLVHDADSPSADRASSGSGR
jgi:hypothetical protein